MNQEIIKLAIAGGFGSEETLNSFNKDYHFQNTCLLDKEFWIALGKSLGLERYDKGLCSVTGEWEDLNPAFFADCLPHREATLTPDSLAHQFLDARFEGREQEFFKELIEK